MEGEQIMIQVITQAATETTKTVIMAFSEAENLVKVARLILEISRTGGLVLKQPTFNWKPQHK